MRIFTPARELPFAGHPTVGTAVLLAPSRRRRRRPRHRARGAGRAGAPARCSRAAPAARATFAIPKLPEHLGAGARCRKARRRARPQAADLGCANFAPENWNAGISFTFVPVRDLETIGRARPDMSRWGEAFGPGDPPGAFLFCREVADPAHAFHARMFAPAMGIVEDPATGSAVAAFAGVLAASGLGDGRHDFVIEQGYEMGRPSLLHLSLSLRGGALESATVGGDAVIVSEGMIEA